MGRGWSTALKGSVLVLATLSVVSASSQIGFGNLVQRRLLSDLKKAQEAAGIYVDDAHLFENPIITKGRRLQQTASDVTATLSNPTIMAAIAGLMTNGSTVGGFPGISLNLPGGSNAGYSPTDNSYCIFSTAPRNSSTGSAATISGLPGGLPSSFTCVEGSTPGPNGFVVSYNSTTYSCTNSAAPGRKLLQAGTAVSPALANLSSEAALNAVFENILNAVGLPVWNCLIATTPAGNTTFGQATLAVLNDLGVVAQHFLTYLNAEDGLTYAQDIQNDFVSLTNPLYPSGPRFNFSIDFETVAADRALFREVFGFPAPPSPPPAAPVTANTASPATPTTGGTVPTGSTPSNTAQTQGSSQGSQSTQTQTQSSNTGATSQATTGSPASTTAATSTPTTPAVTTPAPVATMTVFDGYLSNCQIVIGSVPGGDGNFNRNNDFQAVVIDGQTSLSMNATQLYNGSASYVIPAAKNVAYTALTQATRSTAQFCYDLATLQPVYNPIASIITANSAGMAGNALTTLAVFGQAYGATPQTVVQALGVSIPDNSSLFTYNALGEAINGSAQGLAFLKVNTALTNLVTAGATLLTNDSSSYASFAIIMDQAVARKIQFSPPLTSQGRKLLQTGAPAVDLTNATTITSIIQIAQQIAQSSADPTVRGAQTSDLTQEEIQAVAGAVANLNSATQSASDVTSTQLSQLYGQSTLSSAVSSLARGETTTSDFANSTNSAGISTALSGALPGTLLPTPTVAVAPAPADIAVTRTQAATTSTSSSSSSSGLSHGGKVALAVVFPIVGVIAIVAGIAFFLSRRNRSEPASGTVWYRRPFAQGQTAQSAV